MPHGDGTGPIGGRRGDGCHRRGTAECRREGGPGRGECRRESGAPRGDDCRQETAGPSTRTEPSGRSEPSARPTPALQVATPPLSAPPQPVRSIAVCAAGPAWSDRVHDRFGRAACFHLVDLETMTTCVIANDENRAGAEGAGIGAVELLAEHGAQAAIVTKVGPKAADAFRHAGIPVYAAAGLTVGEAAAALLRGDLARLDLA